MGCGLMTNCCAMHILFLLSLTNTLLDSVAQSIMTSWGYAIIKNPANLIGAFSFILGLGPTDAGIIDSSLVREPSTHARH